MTLPWDELEARVGAGHDRALADRLHVSRGRVAALRGRDLSVPEADLLATNAGMHPSEVWTDWDQSVRDWAET